MYVSVGAFPPPTKETQNGTWSEASLVDMYDQTPVGSQVTVVAFPADTPNTLVPCPNKCEPEGGASGVLHVLIKDMEEHLKNRCPKRMVECPHCKVRGPCDVISDQHDAVCEKKKILCPNPGCSMLVKRYKMRYHIMAICECTEIACEFANIGCEEKVMRKDLAEHKVEARERHLDLAMETLSLREERHLALMDGEPITFKIQDFAAKCEMNTPIMAPSFYTDTYGYKMDLIIFLNGDSTASRGHISVYVRNMVGMFDHNLPWPVMGCCRVTVLNQFANENHYSQTFEFSEEQNVQPGSLIQSPKFMPHAHLSNPPNRNADYIQDDTIYFKVNMSTTNCKPWLMCT